MIIPFWPKILNDYSIEVGLPIPDKANLILPMDLLAYFCIKLCLLIIHAYAQNLYYKAKLQLCILSFINKIKIHPTVGTATGRRPFIINHQPK